MFTLKYLQIKRSDLEKTEIKNKLKEKESEISRLLQIIASESQSRLSVEETKKLLAEKVSFLIF